MTPEYADPDCPRCGGRGWIYASSMLVLPGEKGGRYCECAQDILRLKNMDRIWRSLSEARMPGGLRRDPPLKKLLGRNAWITAKEEHFRAHLKALAFTMPDLWDAKVYSDKDLLKAWLNTAYAQGHKIFDTELNDTMVTVRAMYIDELVEPPEHVILMLGVKQAPNKETPNVLLEAVRSRMHIGRPMWIVDQPDSGIDQVHHRGYSEQLDGLLQHWPHWRLGSTAYREVRAVEDVLVRNPARDFADVEEIVDDKTRRQLDEFVADLDEDKGEDEEEEVEVEDGEEEGEGEEEEIEDEEEFEEEEEEEEARPSFLAQLVENDESQEQRSRKKSSFKKKTPFKKGGRRG